MKFLKRFNIVILMFIFTCSQSLAAAAERGKDKTLCTVEEEVYFSCHISGTNKIASVCASRNTSPDDGYVQYRYGTQKKVDLKYPSALVPPRNILSIIDVSRSAFGIGAHLKFTSGDYRYVVSDALIPGGVYVTKSGVMVSDKICKWNNRQTFSSKSKLGIPWGLLEKIDDLDGPWLD